MGIDGPATEAVKKLTRKDILGILIFIVFLLSSIWGFVHFNAAPGEKISIFGLEYIKKEPNLNHSSQSSEEQFNKGLSLFNTLKNPIFVQGEIIPSGFPKPNNTYQFSKAINQRLAPFYRHTEDFYFIELSNDLFDGYKIYMENDNQLKVRKYKFNISDGKWDNVYETLTDNLGESLFDDGRTGNILNRWIWKFEDCYMFMSNPDVHEGNIDGYLDVSCEIDEWEKVQRTLTPDLMESKDSFDNRFIEAIQNGKITFEANSVVPIEFPNPTVHYKVTKSFQKVFSRYFKPERDMYIIPIDNELFEYVEIELNFLNEITVYGLGRKKDKHEDIKEYLSALYGSPSRFDIFLETINDQHNYTWRTEKCEIFGRYSDDGEEHPWSMAISCPNTEDGYNKTNAS